MSQVWLIQKDNVAFLEILELKLVKSSGLPLPSEDDEDEEMDDNIDEFGERA